MTFTKKTFQTLIGITAIVASMTFGSLQTYAATVQELAFSDNTVELTVCNYKFNFTKYYNDITNQLNSTPYDKYDPAGATKYCYIQTGFVCNSGATIGNVPVLGLFQNTVNGITYKPQGDITVGAGVNYCLNASIPEIFKAIAPNNNTNLIPSIYNKSGKTGAAGERYYNPGAWDNGLCQRNSDGSVTMLPEYEAAYNDPDQAYRDAFRASLNGRNCNVTPIERKVYQFRYVIEYPSNDVCNTFYSNLKPKVTAAYEADANGQAIRTIYKLVSGKQDSQFSSTDLTNFYNYFKNYNGSTSPAFGTTSGKIDCPTFYKSAFGSKFGLTSSKGIVATDTYHLVMNENYDAWIGWRKVEVGRRLNETDGLKKAWDGYAAFNLEDSSSGSSTSNQTIAQIASSNPNLSTLVTALGAADLVGAVSDPNANLTVFAPTNDAFSKVSGLKELLLPANKSTLQNILKYHVLASRKSGDDLSKLSEITMLNGSKVTLKVQGSDLILNNNVKVITKDIQASNGTIHVIDTVLIP